MRLPRRFTERKSAILAERGIVVLVALCALNASATHYYVAPGGTGDYSQGNPGGDPNYCSRVHAVNQGDVIHLAAGTYVLGSTPAINGTVPNQQIFLKRGVKLIGATDDPADTILDGNGSGRVFCCTYESEVRNVTMRNGKTAASQGSGFGYGGAVCAQSDTYPNYVISNCVVDGCSATYRGGGGSHGIWYDCVIRNCSVTYPGWKTNSTAVVAFRDEGSGGGIWAGTLYRCTVTNNSAAFIGGGIAGGGGTLLNPTTSKANLDACIAYDCTIGWNSAALGGGCGVRNGPDNTFPAQWASKCQMVRCTIVSNTTHDVGGFYANKGGGSDGAYLTNCVVRGNQANYYGGGVIRSVAVGCTIEGNVVLKDTETDPANHTHDRGYGGGAHLSTLTNCVVLGNAAPDGGGCSDSALVGCTVSNNVATAHNGGGLYNGTSLNCVIAFNEAVSNRSDTANARGGGICKGYHQGDLVYSNLFVNGAAVTAAKGGTDITIVNCTVYDNPTINNSNQNGFNSGYATNCLIYGHSNTDIYNCRALVNCAWREDMLTHNQSDPTLASVTNNFCMRGRTFNPKFVTNPAEGQCPFSLAKDSPCEDAGVTHPWMTGAKDILGNDRIFKATAKVDIGALECFWIPGVTIIFR